MAVRLTPDPKNANKGTPRGRALLEDSLRRYGAGRSILVDKHGTVIAGNKTLEAAVDIGLGDPVVVPSDGTRLVVVQRTDLDLGDVAAKELALADNRVAQVSLDWDLDILQQVAGEGVDLTKFWLEDELARTFQQAMTDPQSAWEGMPEFVNDPKSYKSVMVHFDSQEAVDDFARRIGQSIGPKTKYLWHRSTTI